MLSRVLGGVGRTLITAGTLILLFVAYQLWGTGLQEQKSQKDLTKQLDRLEAADAKAAATSTTTTTTTTQMVGDPGGMQVSVRPTQVLPQDLPLPGYGDPIGVIKIPKIGITRTIVEGVGRDELKRGPGHYPQTPLPGQAGNASIAGHRTTYGQPFHNIDKLAPGDEILITTRQRPDKPFVYKVQRTFIVRPNQGEVLWPTKDHTGKLENRLTLTACHPKYSARQRIVITALLVGEPAPPLVGQAKAREKIIAKQKKEGVAGDTIDDSSGQAKESKAPAFVWGFVCAAIWLAAWLVQVALRRRLRNRADEVAPTRGQRLLTWSPYLVGLPIFLLALYVFFENFARLLPPNF